VREIEKDAYNGQIKPLKRGEGVNILAFFRLSQLDLPSLILTSNMFVLVLV